MNKLNINFRRPILFALLGSVLAISSCKKDKFPAIEPGPSTTSGVYVLCETGYDKVGTLTYYDIAKGTAEQDYFKKQNNIDLGVNVNDLKQYGSKMYCVITGTKPEAKDSYLEVINIATGKSIKRIPFSDETAGFLPRFIVFNKNKAYISGYDGNITKIDTGNLDIEARIKVGGALEGLTIVNNKLYVTNSAHYLFATENNSSVSVVDLNTFTKLKDITVGFNPTRISATNAGDLFVVTKGNYGDIEPSLDRVSSITDTKLGTNDIGLDFLKITGDKGFVIGGDYLSPFLKMIDISTGELGSNFITDGTAVTTPYSVTVNTFNDDVFVADANGYAAEGKVICFSAQGKKKFEFTTGGSPQSAVFNYNYK